MDPVYTTDVCRFSCPLQWGLTVFWREDMPPDDWLPVLSTALEPDGIRVLGHRHESSTVSQFMLSTLPQVSPSTIVQRVKGRLQYCVRDQRPKALRGNFALRSVGNETRAVVERYVAKQVEHHPIADPRVVARLERLQIAIPEVDLREPQRTSQGLFWYNLHLVLVHRDRWMDINEESLQAICSMILRASAAKCYLLSRGGILPDHLHLTLGCPFEVAPIDVALGFLNNLAYVHGMKPVYQYGGFIGTFGEYDNRAVKSDSRP